jgi:hypothetical protein
MEGKFDEAIAAFHQARELEPKHPHVAGRLAEVARRQQEASVMALASATSWPNHPRTVGDGVTARGLSDGGRIARVFAGISPASWALWTFRYRCTHWPNCVLHASSSPKGKSIMLAVAEEAVTIEALEVDPIVHIPTITTLYELIEALQNQVEPEDDAAVTAAVVHLFNAGYVKFLNMS